MKFIKRLLAFAAFGILAVLGFVFWPKIRECAERCLAAGCCCADEPEEVPTEVVEDS